MRLARAQSALLPSCNVVVEREDLVRGFQHAKDQYVPITEDELESLEAEANRSIDLQKFIPLTSVDPVYFENTHYLGADKGGEKPYRLLADAMAKSARAGWTSDALSMASGAAVPLSPPIERAITSWRLAMVR
jgi:non-homologous end joining protein Ku